MNCESNIVPVLTNASPWISVAQAPLSRPFDEGLLDFVNDLSTRLLNDVRVRHYSELVALGYWMRRANLARVIEQAQLKFRDEIPVPRGTVFHIAPANVDTIFVYSWILSLMCGNRNIIRLSNSAPLQLDLLLQTIDACLGEDSHQKIASSVAMVRYEHSDEINQRLSAKCDTRVIWGGDDTVRAIRRAVLPATANEVAFANKMSFCLIDCRFWTTAESSVRKQVAERFANDAYQFGQAACSSPRVVVWHGEPLKSTVADEFWSNVSEASVDFSGELQDVDFVNKLVTANRVAVAVPVKVHPARNNRVTRITFERDRLHEILHSDIHCGGGLFYETTIPSLEYLLPAMTRNIQTVTYAGLTADTLRAFFTAHVCQGIDRVVPMGQALDFSPVWDGFDLFEVFLRHVTVK